ncbi:hypothetical protein [Erysipelothrix tonsillarum]|uniref:hypothetical protein n=1 Tax=Erysipelothrix tonsillarum TaxID=38402 RepID=UPI0003A6272C|nr:hypothetical protein [Erysipelothrix tonsillarum]
MMFNEALQKLKAPRTLIQWTLFTIFFFGIYTLIDSFNLSYRDMVLEFGIYLVIINVCLNLLMALLSGLLMVLNTIMVDLKGIESKGANLSFVSIIFGILTYGCTPCVIAFFANIGIAFSVIALPLAGLPYKLLSLVLILLGLGWTRYEINNTTCKIKAPTA